MHIFEHQQLWIITIIAIVGDFLVAYLLAPFYPGYNHAEQVMSVLGNNQSPIHKIYNIWLVILGILIVFSGILFYQYYKFTSHSLSLVGLMILIFYGIGACILSGIFSVNNEEDRTTISAKIHGIAAGVGFMALTFLSLIIGLLDKEMGEIIIGTLSIILFILCILLFVLFIMSDKKQFRNTIIGKSGLWQRLLLGTMYCPLLIISIRNLIM